MGKKKAMKTAVGLFCMVFMFAGATYAITMLSVPATVDDINVKAKTMDVTYADPDSKETKHAVVQWDQSTEFIKEGPPPDMKEGPAKPGEIKKGAKVYIRIEEKAAKGGKRRLDVVRIKP